MAMDNEKWSKVIRKQQVLKLSNHGNQYHGLDLTLQAMRKIIWKQTESTSQYCWFIDSVILWYAADKSWNDSYILEC